MGLVTDALLKRIRRVDDECVPMDVAWAAAMETLLSDQPMPSGEQLDVLAESWKARRIQRALEMAEAT